MKKTPAISAVYVVIAAIMWGAIGVFMRRLRAAGLDSIEILQTRATTGFLFTGLFLLIFKRKAFKIRLEDLWCFLGTGIGALFLTSYFYYQGIAVSSMAIMAALLYTAPAFVIILSSIIFREKLTAAKIAAILLTFFGCVLVSGVGTDVAISVKILLYGLGSGFCYCMYSIYSRFAIQREYDTWTITFYTMLFCALICALFCNWPYLLSTLCAAPVLIGWSFGNGLVTAFGAFGLYTLGLSGMQNGTASVTASLEPVAAAVFGAVLYQESISLLQTLGIVLVLGGIAVVALWKKKA